MKCLEISTIFAGIFRGFVETLKMLEAKRLVRTFSVDENIVETLGKRKFVKNLFGNADGQMVAAAPVGQAILYA